MGKSYVEDRLQEIADAIREKEGSVDPIPAPDFASRILEIQTGVDTSDATATAEDILERKTAYVNGVKIRGTMENIGAATPSITVEPTTGIVTAKTDQKRGFVDASQKSASVQLDTQSDKTVTPSTIARTAVARGLYTTGDVIVAGDANLIHNNIRKGVSIFGVHGSIPVYELVRLTGSLRKETSVSVAKPGFLNDGKIHGINGYMQLVTPPKNYQGTDANFGYVTSLIMTILSSGDIYQLEASILNKSGSMRYVTMDDGLSCTITSSSLTFQIASSLDAGFPIAEPILFEFE